MSHNFLLLASHLQQLIVMKNYSVSHNFHGFMSYMRVGGNSKAFLRVVQNRKKRIYGANRREKAIIVVVVDERSKWLTLLVVCACMNIMALARIRRSSRSHYYGNLVSRELTKTIIFMMIMVTEAPS